MRQRNLPTGSAPRRSAAVDGIARAGVRSNGLDYLEVDDDQVTLTVYFLGKLPTHLQKDRKALARHVRIEGGRRDPRYQGRRGRAPCQATIPSSTTT